MATELTIGKLADAAGVNVETIRFTGLAGNAVYFIVSGESGFSGVSVRVQ